MNILIAIVVFSFIILFHELGHFLLAKRNGVQVNEFCLGLGPTLFGFRKGETYYSLKLFPFGGACMMEGEDDESDSERAFGKKTVWQRFAIVFAGPFFNFILAWVFSLIILGMAGIDYPRIQEITPGSPAEEVGIQAGDTIVKLGTKPIHFYREISIYTYFHDKSEPIQVTWEHEGERRSAELTPRYDEQSDRYLIGFDRSYGRQKANPLQVFIHSFYEMKYWVTTTLQSLGQLVTGQLNMNDLSGPVGIVKTIGDTYTKSKTEGWLIVFLNMLNMTVLLSANLGVMNLLPLPALDGGRLVFFIIEAIRGKKMDPQKEGMVHYVGLILLMALMVVVMGNDIRKLF
ncbi:MAG: RIP metalloprotease RseP [Eubacterium sp.]|nr:RIP metalloprotease RseP [Eubacterium sp.]